LVEVDPNTGKRYVLVGTGELLSSDDVSTSPQENQKQTFYAIVDGTSEAGKFYTAATLPSGVSFPITRADLSATDMLTGLTDTSKVMGWYFDLADDGISERVNVQPTATSDGIVGFAANLPSGNACSLAGTARAFAISFGLGVTAITDTIGALTPYVGVPSAATDIEFESVNSTVRLYVGTMTGTVNQIGTSFAGDKALKRLNWREIQTAD